VNVCPGILPFRDNLPIIPYQQEFEFPQSQPVGGRESFWNCFVNICVGTFGDYLLEPYLFPLSLTGPNCHLPVFQEFIPLTIRHTIYFTHDKSSLHFSLYAPHHAYDTYLTCWVRRVGPTLKAYVRTSICADN